jgi:hypothetical protein
MPKEGAKEILFSASRRSFQEAVGPPKSEKNFHVIVPATCRKTTSLSVSLQRYHLIRADNANGLKLPIVARLRSFHSPFFSYDTYRLSITGDACPSKACVSAAGGEALTLDSPCTIPSRIVLQGLIFFHLSDFDHFTLKFRLFSGLLLPSLLGLR